MHYYTESNELNLCMCWGTVNKRFVLPKEESLLFHDDYGRCIGYRKAIFTSPSEIKIDVSEKQDWSVFETRKISPQSTKMEERLYYNDIIVFCHN